MRSALLAIALGALLAPQQSRDTVGQPQRDTAGAPAAGTGLLGGQVLDEASNRPLRRAVVTINGDNGVRRTTITDDEGKFAFKTLAAGLYTMSATKPAYVQVFYGARRPGRGPGTAINLVAGQQLSTLQLKVPHGSAITGRIVDMNGRPQPNVRVQISERRLVNGERKLLPAPGSAGGASTDDRGVYRAFGLPAGEYVVLATPAFGGGPGDLRMTSAEDVQWAQQQLQQKNSAAATIGAASLTPPTPPPSQPVAFAPVFYPGTTDIANAATVSISAGDERSGIDFALLLVPTATIVGVILNPDGRPAMGTVTLVTSSNTGMSMSSRSTDAKGSFSFPNQSPGQYRLVAKGAGGSGAGGGGAGGGGAAQAETFVRMVGRGGDIVTPQVDFGPQARPGAPSMWATADVSVAGVDITGIGLTLQPGASMPGKIVFKGAGAAPADLTKIRVSMLAASASEFGLTTMNVAANADGTFKVEGLGPGKYRVTSNGAAAPWFLKSALVDGVDVLDDSLEVKAGADVSEMTLVFADRPTEVSGKLIDATGAPASGYSMIAFSTNKATWTIQGARRTKSARPATDGKYVISGLPPGEYFLAAVTDFDQTDLTDAAFLEEIAAGALKITIGEGEKKIQDLRLARTP